MTGTCLSPVATSPGDGLRWVELASATVFGYTFHVPRLARLVLPSIPHHVTQRGSRRQPTFFSEADYARYVSLLGHWCRKAGTAIWA